MRERAYRNILSARARESGHVIQTDAARDLHATTASGQGYGLGDQRGAEVVEQDRTGTGIERLAQLFEVLALALYPPRPFAREGGRYRGTDAAGGFDVVLLYEDSVKEAAAMIVSAPATHRIFVQRAVAGERLAGVEYSRLRTGGRYTLHECGRQCGDAGKPRQEVERGTFEREQSSWAARELTQRPAYSDAFSILT